MINTFASHGGGDNYQGMEVMMWDPKAKEYRDNALWYDSPDRWIFTGNFEGETLVYYGEFDYLGKRVRFRSETRPVAGGGFTLTEFASVNGGPEQLLLVGRAAPTAGQQSEPRANVSGVSPVVNEVIGYEKKSWIAGKNKERAVYAGMLAEDFRRITEDGLTNRNDELRDLNTVDLQEYSLSDMRGTEVSADVVLLTYKFYVQLSADGQPFAGTFFASSLWAKRQGKWVSVFTQETPTH